jgi:putative nucleotidyltransferase with HDIG domain
LQSAVKAASLYPVGHPGIQAPLNAFFQGLNSLLGAGHPIVLGVIDDVLVLDEIPFYETHTVWRTLFSALRGRGIESITFHDGLEPQEMLGIIRVLKGGDAGDPSDLDSLWKEQNIVHASYREIVEGDDFRARAHQTYQDSLAVVVDLVTELRMGKVPSTRAAVEVVEGMRDLILQDPNALFGMAMMKSYDNYTFNHSVNVSIFSLALGRHMELPNEEFRTLGLAALLHDLGKVRTDESIIKKPGALDDNEMRLMKLHPELGAEILESMQGIRSEAVAMVLQHHVRFDRAGYPRLPKVVEMHPMAEAIALADCYDALTTTRPYQRAHHPSDAARILRRNSGSAFSPELAEQFLMMLGTYPTGEAVRLMTGEVAVVVANNPVDATKPTVRVVIDVDGNPIAKSPRVELADPSEAERRIVSPVDPLSKGIDIAAILEQELDPDP